MNYFERAKSYRAKKRLGQNFLISSETIDKILETAEIQPEDTVVEIGSGLGFVTEQLVQYAKKVIAIELDEADGLKTVGQIVECVEAKGV